MQQLTHTPTENPSTNVHGNQQNIYDINIQGQELEKGMLIENTLKGNLNSQQKTNELWLVTTNKAILKTPIHKSENPFSRSVEHKRHQSGIEKYSRYSKVN